MIGSIRSLLNLLHTSKNIGLIYLMPYWVTNVNKINKKLDNAVFEEIINTDLASKAHIMTTFISSWVFNLEIYKSTDEDFIRAKQISILSLFSCHGFFTPSRKK